jgi:hypothetical protein
MRKLLAVLVITLVASPAMASDFGWKTEKQLPQTKVLPGGDPEKDENCHDTVSHVDTSAYSINEYRTYFEAVRVEIGFGAKSNAATMMPTDLLHPGAYDWGGIDINGVFTPKVVIKRFYIFDGNSGKVDLNKTQLLAFRLKQDGTSCVIPFEKTVTDNALARGLALKALQGPEC